MLALEFMTELWEVLSEMRPSGTLAPFLLRCGSYA